jgi:hypothetical protein
MVIERNNDEVIIPIPANVDTESLQESIDHLIYKEATSKSKSTQEDVDALAIEVKSSWWENNKNKFHK